jgi:hypothetical protein
VDLDEKVNVVEQLKEEIEQLKQENEASTKVKETANCVEEANDVSLTSEDNGEETGEKDNIISVSLADYFKYLDLKKSNSPLLKDFTVTDYKNGNRTTFDLERTAIVSVLRFSVS